MCLFQCESTSARTARDPTLTSSLTIPALLYTLLPARRVTLYPQVVRIHPCLSSRQCPLHGGSSARRLGPPVGSLPQTSIYHTARRSSSCAVHSLAALFAAASPMSALVVPALPSAIAVLTPVAPSGEMLESFWCMTLQWALMPNCSAQAGLSVTVGAASF